MEGKKNVIHIEFWPADDSIDGRVECNIGCKGNDVVMVLADVLPRILNDEEACKVLGMLLFMGDPPENIGIRCNSNRCERVEKSDGGKE